MITVVYYTANVENESFERKIRANILKHIGDLPLISVSRKPIDFGKNICIGEKPICYSNSFRQLLIGLKEAKTKFCIATEADCLYPPEYFQFVPPTEDNAYRYKNIYVYFKTRKKAWKKPICEGAQICGREFWIRSIEKVLEGQPEWEPINKPMLVFDTGDTYGWTSDKPVVTFKTGQGISGRCGIIQDTGTANIPYWGGTMSIYNQYLYEN